MKKVLKDFDFEHPSHGYKQILNPSPQIGWKKNEEKGKRPLQIFDFEHPSHGNR